MKKPRFTSTLPAPTPPLTLSVDDLHWRILADYSREDVASLVESLTAALACPYCGRPGNGEPCAPHCPPREEHP